MKLFKRNKIRTILEDDILIYSPVESGKAMKLASLRDGVFSLKGLGDGITIDVKEDKVDILAPTDGVIEVVYFHGNCIGMATKTGEKILIHVGTEHAHLKEKYSDIFVKQGDKVKKGDKLATVDFKYMKDNKTLTSLEQIIVVVPSGDEVVNKYKGKLSKETNIFAIRKEEK